MRQKNMTLAMFLFFIFFICSCGPNEKYENSISFTPEDFLEKDVLHGKSLNLEELEVPTNIRVKDSILFVVNSRGNRFLNIYNLNDRKKIKEIVEVGSGPEELIMCNSMQIVDNKIYLSDIQQSKFIVYDILTLLNEDKINADTSFNVKNIIMQNPLRISENRFVANDLGTDNQVLTFFDKNGHKEDIKTPFPISKYKSEDPFLQKRKFENRLAVSPSYERIYATYISTDLIEIYDREGNLEKRLHGPAQTFPLMRTVNTPTGRTISPEKGNEMAYLSPITTQGKLWVLYYGRSPELNKPFLADQLLVFSEEGDPLIVSARPTTYLTFDARLYLC